MKGKGTGGTKETEGTIYDKASPLSNRFTLLRLPNALRCRFIAASGILK
ncbi:MAG: hypothetical protein LBJ00_00355 [Planctomycetaceae bacterium]|nr:hypothetical protein [Planctomycetaceae bacterium]